MGNALNPPHTFLIPSLGGKKGKKPLKNPKIIMTVTSCSLGKSRSLDKEDGPSNCCTCKMSYVNFNHIYSTIPRWSPVEGFPQVCCSCSRPTDGTPAPPLPPSSSRSAYYLRWTKLHFCLFHRRGHQQTPWGEQNDVLFLTTILIGTLLISKVIEAQHLSKNIQYVAVESF